MYSKEKKLIQLLWLMQGSLEGVSYEDIEKRFNVSRRTAERMIAEISNTFKGVSTVKGRPKRWLLRKPAIPPKRTNREDLVALDTASQNFKTMGMQTYSERIDLIKQNLISNLRSSGNVRVVREAGLLGEAGGFVHKPGPKEKIDAEIWVTLEAAVIGCNIVSFDYASSGHTQAQRRTVHPYAFLHGNRQYLIANKAIETGQDFRTYILARITNLEMHHEIFPFDEDFSVENFLSDCFGVFQERKYKIVWRFDADVAEAAQQFQFHHTQKFRKMRDGRLEVTFWSGGLLEMSWHIITWGNKVEVVKPKALINQLREVRDSIRLPESDD